MKYFLRDLAYRFWMSRRAATSTEDIWPERKGIVDRLRIALKSADT